MADRNKMDGAAASSAAEKALKEAVRGALRETKVPGLQQDVVSLGLLAGVRVDAGRASITLTVGNPDPERRRQLSDAVKTAVGALDGIESVGVILMDPPPKGRTSPLAGHHRPFATGGEAAPAAAVAAPAGQSCGTGSKPSAEADRGGNPFDDQTPLRGVKRVLVVASGKGGVGKSSVAVNLAVALQQLGHSVGLMDADIYGPSLPLMAGPTERPKALTENRILPVEKFGLSMMSIGFLLEKGEALVWRGPMLMGVVRQFLRDVQWGGLDYLVIDLPPGTGDVHLSVAQITQVWGAVVVTTPQDLALADVRRSVRMFEKVDVPVLGYVENMSGFVCDECGTETPIFGRGGGGARQAAEFGLPLLAEIPLDPQVGVQGDAGVPVVISHPRSAASKALVALARRVAAAQPVRLTS
jgi:ATP-binding protein involved in chromosome partitioning